MERGSGDRPSPQAGVGVCRSSSAGGRRCPACSSDRARARHNKRRREARTARAAVIAWAQEQGYDQPVRDLLPELSPREAQFWAIGQGMPLDGPHPQRRLWSEPLELREQDVTAITTICSTQTSPAEQQLLAEVRGGDDDIDGSNGVIMYELENGGTGYFKGMDTADVDLADDYGHTRRVEQALYEVGAYRLARAMGPEYETLVPPVVVRSVHGDVGVMSWGVPGSVGAAYSGAVAPEDLRRAAFFDALSGQQDRHHGNYLVDEGDEGGSAGFPRLYLIDHGFGFMQDNDYVNSQLFSGRRLARGARLNDKERSILQRMLRDSTSLGMTDVLASNERVYALRSRAERMLRRDRLPEGEGFYRDTDQRNLIREQFSHLVGNRTDEFPELDDNFNRKPRGAQASTLTPVGEEEKS